MAVRKTPEGSHTITTRIFVEGASRLVDFLRTVFGAEGEYITYGAPSHVRIGDSSLMISDAGPREVMPAYLYIYVDDTDATYRRAVAAGATTIEEPKDQFYGDRRAMVRDPFGNIWQIATHQEDVPPDEIRRRLAGGRR